MNELAMRLRQPKISRLNEIFYIIISDIKRKIVLCHGTYAMPSHQYYCLNFITSIE